jgi:hypothetical protein
MRFVRKSISAACGADASVNCRTAPARVVELARVSRLSVRRQVSVVAIAENSSVAELLATRAKQGRADRVR